MKLVNLNNMTTAEKLVVLGEEYKTIVEELNIHTEPIIRFYDPNYIYSRGDKVLFEIDNQALIFVALRTTQHETPSLIVNDSWAQISEKAVRGEKGDKGDRGEQGFKGEPGVDGDMRADHHFLLFMDSTAEYSAQLSLDLIAPKGTPKFTTVEDVFNFLKNRGFTTGRIRCGGYYNDKTVSPSAYYPFSQFVISGIGCSVSYVTPTANKAYAILQTQTCTDTVISLI